MSEPKYTRDDLIQICESAVVPEDKWSNRDSCSAQEKVGMAWVFLKAGVPFEFVMDDDLACDERTIWLRFKPKDFMSFEVGGRHGDELCYLPTEKRLSENEGGDWY